MRDLCTSTFQESEVMAVLYAAINDSSTLEMLDGQLYGAAMYIGLVTLSLVWVAWGCRKMNFDGRVRVTQQARYFLLTVGAAAAFIPMMRLAYIYGWDNFWESFNSRIDREGWPMALCLYIGLSAPVWFSFIAWRIYRKPALAGRRVRGGYKLTADMRDKLEPCPVVVRSTMRIFEEHARREGWYRLSGRQLKRQGLNFPFLEPFLPPA